MTWLAHPVLLACTLALTALPAQQPEWPPSALYGRVLSVLHEGVPAAEVRVTNARGELVARTFSDGSGYYQVMRLPAGPLEVHAQAEGKVWARMKVPAEGLVRAATLQLQDGGELQGKVTWPDGSPVADADVLLSFNGGRYGQVAWWGECTTGADGAWSIADAPLGPVHMRVFAPGFEVVSQQITWERSEVVETVVPKAAATLRKVEVRGLPEGVEARVVSGATTSYGDRRQPWVPRRALEAVVDEAGIARMWSLPFAHELRVEATGFTSMPVFVRCTAGSVAEHVFDMRPLPDEVVTGSTLLRGRVVDAVGTPLPGAAVIASYRDQRIGPVLVDERGAFEIRVPVYEGVLVRLGLLPGARYVANPQARLGDDGISWLAINANASKEVRLDTVEAGGVRGVLRAADKRPWIAANVTLSQHGAPVMREAVATATDSVGRVDVTGLPPGTYTLRASDASGREGRAEVEVVAGEPVEPGELTFAAGGVVVGVVRFADGTRASSMPLSIATAVRARGRRGVAFGGSDVMSDREGRFRIPFVPEGSWAIAAGVSLRVPQMRNQTVFDVEADRTVEVEVSVDQ